MTFVINFCVAAEPISVGHFSKLCGNLRKSICILDIAAKTAFCIVDNAFGFT